MITLSNPPYTVQLREGFPKAVDPALPDPQCLTLDEGGHHEPTSCHRVEVLHGSEKVAQLQLQASKGETGIHQHSACIADDILFIACGAYVTALQLPDLHLLWSTQVDELTCFGVHHNLVHHCLITHGELSITRINFDGSLVWQANADKVFTGPLEADGAVISVTDDAGNRHEFDASTGTSTAAQRATV